MTSDGVVQELSDGGRILGMTAATTATGAAVAAADTVLRYTEVGFRQTADGYAEFGSDDSTRVGVADATAAVSVDLGISGLAGFAGSDAGDVIASAA